MAVLGSMFRFTEEALQELEETLVCGLCKGRLTDPVLIGRCEHVFCLKCVSGCRGNQCPECHVPVAAKDSHGDLQLSTLLTLCEQLHSILNECKCSDENKCSTNAGTEDVSVTPKRENRDLSSTSKVTSEKTSEREGNVNQLCSPQQKPRIRKDEVCTPRSTALPSMSLRSISLYSPPSRARDMGRKRRAQSANYKFKDKRNVKGETLLHVAAIKGNLSAVRDLLKRGANPNVKDNAGWTPLHEASNHGFKEIVKCLLDYGAVVNVPGHDNITPLHDAVLNHQLEVAQYLASRGGDLHARTSQGFTALDFCVKTETKEALMNAAVRHITDPTVSPSFKVDSKNTKCVFLPTGLNDEEKEKLEECAELLDAQIVEHFCKEVTHVIAACDDMGQCNRTLKVLQGILGGKWIMNFQWVELCLEYKQKVEEEIYEVPGTKQQKDTYGPKKARENTLQQFPPLFDGCNFYLYGQFSAPSPTRDDICSLIHQGGGKILVREPKPDSINWETLTVPYHVTSCIKLSNANHFILYQFQPPREVHLSAGPVRTVNIFWLIDSVSTFQLLDPDKVEIPKLK